MAEIAVIGSFFSKMFNEVQTFDAASKLAFDVLVFTSVITVSESVRRVIQTLKILFDNWGQDMTDKDKELTQKNFPSADVALGPVCLTFVISWLHGSLEIGRNYWTLTKSDHKRIRAEVRNDIGSAAAENFFAFLENGIKDESGHGILAYENYQFMEGIGSPENIKELGRFLHDKIVILFADLGSPRFWPKREDDELALNAKLIRDADTRLSTCQKIVYSYEDKSGKPRHCDFMVMSYYYAETKTTFYVRSFDNRPLNTLMGSIQMELNGKLDKIDANLPQDVKDAKIRSITEECRTKLDTAFDRCYQRLAKLLREKADLEGKYHLLRFDDNLSDAFEKYVELMFRSDMKRSSYDLRVHTR